MLPDCLAGLGSSAGSAVCPRRGRCPPRPRHHTHEGACRRDDAEILPGSRISPPLYLDSTRAPMANAGCWLSRPLAPLAAWLEDAGSAGFSSRPGRSSSRSARMSSAELFRAALALVARPPRARCPARPRRQNGRSRSGPGPPRDFTGIIGSPPLNRASTRGPDRERLRRGESWPVGGNSRSEWPELPDLIALVDVREVVRCSKASWCG